MMIGPDLNATKGPLDKKLYRQIILPNGLRCLLIQDTLAMQQAALEIPGGLTHADSEADDEEYLSDVEYMVQESPNHRRHPHRNADVDAEIFDDVNPDDDDGCEGLRDGAAAVLVGTGSLYDPLHCQGLSHFLEHLLFMGSEKYPGENDFESFVAKHGGSDNAFTEWEYTVYSLSIPQEYLFQAVDRLAQFFVAPLLLESSIDRELNAIESEFQLNLQSDANRLDQLICATSAADHPFAKFGWGNLKSLRDIPGVMGVDPMKELRTFFDRYYYASNMRLVVSGAYTLDEMQNKVVEQFSDVPALPRDFSGHFRLPIIPDKMTLWDSPYQSPIAAAGFPLKKDHGLCRIFRVVPIKEKHLLSITWQIPSVDSQWRSKPAEYLSHLLGHEAAGSLLSFFRSKSLAVSCMVGVGDGGIERSSCHALFVATFVLSEHGLSEWRSVVDGVFQYIGMLRYFCELPDGLPRWIYEELRCIQELSYRFRDEQAPAELVESIVEDMAPHRNLPPNRLLDGFSLLFEFDEAAIKELLNTYLTPAACRIDLVSSSFGKAADYENHCIRCESTETIIKSMVVLEESEDGFFEHTESKPHIEPMFGTPFWCHALPTSLLRRWTELANPRLPSIDIHLPPLNPFVPRNFDLRPFPEEDSDHPLLNASLKVCVPIGRTKQWFPATVMRYNQRINAVLLSFEDEDEKWHTLDTSFEEFPKHESIAAASFEGSMDSRRIKYCIVALSIPGRGPVRMFGDAFDFNVKEGISFPAIPPPSRHLPVEVSNTNTLKMWWLQDRNFKRPISEFRLQLICAKANSTPLHRACADLFRNICTDALAETSYLAEMCELHLSIESTEVGFYIRVHGFNDKLIELFDVVMRFVLSFRALQDSLPDSVRQERFVSCLEVLSRRYKNSGMAAAGLACDLRLQTLRPTLWSANKLLKAVDGISVTTFVTTISSILEDFAVEALLHGNVDRNDAFRARDLVLRLLKDSGGTHLPLENYPSQSVTFIPETVAPHLLTCPSKDPAEPNTSCEIYAQVGKDNIRERTLMDLLIQLLHEPFFDQLRTKDQFGYSVSCSCRWSYGIIGCVFHVTTNTKTAMETVARVDRFLSSFRDELVGMKNVDFFGHKVALAKEKLDMFNSMEEMTDSFWNEIRDGRFEWEVRREEALCLRGITKEETIAAFDKWLRPGCFRRMFVVQIIGTSNSVVSKDRPVIGSESVEDFCDRKVEEFLQDICMQRVCGRVTAKLF